MSARGHKLSDAERASLAARVSALKSEGLPRSIIAQRLGVTVGFISTVTREAEEAAAKEASLTAQQWAERCGEVTKENER